MFRRFTLSLSVIDCPEWQKRYASSTIPCSTSLFWDENFTINNTIIVCIWCKCGSCAYWSNLQRELRCVQGYIWAHDKLLLGPRRAQDRSCTNSSRLGVCLLILLSLFGLIQRIPFGYASPSRANKKEGCDIQLQSSAGCWSQIMLSPAAACLRVRAYTYIQQ